MDTLFRLHPVISSHGVLVVDDSSDHRSGIIDLLRMLGCSKTYEAKDGHVALDMIRNFAILPAVLIVDLQMPNMDGIELVQRLAEENRQPAVIIATEGDNNLISSVELIIDALNLPLLGALQKPCNAGQLQGLLNRFNATPTPPSSNPTIANLVSPEMLQIAIRSGDIIPAYQPKVSLSTGRVVGVEALARWTDQNGNQIPPGSFIQVAERYDLIQELTLAMLGHVLSDLKHWQAHGADLIVALNLSGKTISDKHLADEIIRRVESDQVSPTKLIFEVTESALVSDMATSLATLVRLRLHGFGLSIDDYGTGFSSMQQLARVPFTELKIDRSFISSASRRDNVFTILDSAIDMGLRLGLTTVAEGVETAEEVELLKFFGCNLIQGFLIAKPMASNELIPWLQTNQKRLNKMCSDWNLY